MRVGGDPATYAPRIRQAVFRVDPDLPVLAVRTMPQLIRDRTRFYRFQSPPFIVVGLAALILSLVGLYAVASYLASLRAAEFGIRAALGARRFDLIGRAVLSVGWPTALGILGGLGGGLWLTRGFDRWVFLSDPWDPWVVAASLGTLTLSTLVASLLPARRASRVDLIEVLSSD